MNPVHKDGTPVSPGIFDIHLGFLIYKKHSTVHFGICRELGVNFTEKLVHTSTDSGQSETRTYSGQSETKTYISGLQEESENDFLSCSWGPNIGGCTPKTDYKHVLFDTTHRA